MPTLAVKVTRVFFDRAEVINSMDKASYGALVRAASFLWTRERTSMRKRKEVSQPGAPPNAHAGQLRSTKFNQFAYDLSTKSAVVGPSPFQEGTAPAVLEGGGQAYFTSKRGATQLGRYAARPYMGPALAIETASGNIPRQWANSLNVG